MKNKISERVKKLTAEQYEVTQRKGTEPPFTGEYLHTRDKGVFRCVVCGNVLFKSDDKYDSGSGWPSFTRPSKKENVRMKSELLGTEVICSKCGSHLGHVFDDGPEPTGKRFCINSASLEFKKAK